MELPLHVCKNCGNHFQGKYCNLCGEKVYSEKEKIQMAPPVVRIRNTVGAGDSMVAGMVAVLVTQGPMDEILRMGIACGSATTMAEGSALFAKEDVDRLFNKIRQVFD